MLYDTTEGDSEINALILFNDLTDKLLVGINSIRGLIKNKDNSEGVAKQLLEESIQIIIMSVERHIAMQSIERGSECVLLDADYHDLIIMGVMDVFDGDRITFWFWFMGLHAEGVCGAVLSKEVAITCGILRERIALFDVIAHEDDKNNPARVNQEDVLFQLIKLLEALEPIMPVRDEIERNYHVSQK